MVGGLLAVLIVWIFLRNWRITLISALAIPTSVIATFALMNWMGFTMNMLTMLALSLSIGLLIDDAIVVVETIFRHMEEGKTAPHAASFGTAEIGLAAFAITMSVVAVFLPVAFMQGIIGRFFYQFGMTVAFAVLISLLVAFTLVPMLASRFLTVSHQHGLFFRLSELVLTRIDRGYGGLLSIALRWRWTTAGVAILVMFAAILVGSTLRSEFIPQEDRGEFTIKVTGPLDASLQATDALLKEVRKQIAAPPWLVYTYSAVGAGSLGRANEGSIYVKMVDKDQRNISQSDAMIRTRERLANFEGADITVIAASGGPGGGGADVQLELRGKDLQQLDAYAEALIAELRKTPGYFDIASSHESGKPEVRVNVRRGAAVDLGVSPAAVAGTVRALMGGADVAKFTDGGERYDVSLRLLGEFLERPENIAYLTVRSNRGDLVRLQSIVDVVAAEGPVQIQRFDRARQITVSANLNPELKTLGDAVNDLTANAEALNMPTGYLFGFGGSADTMQESFAALLFALLLSVVMIYMVLASQFESFVHPFTIMLSLPLSAVGALGALALANMSISIFTMIGFIMLMGLVTKNAILLIDYTNTLRNRDGLTRLDALLKAGPTRLRPILMTTLAMIFGMLPIALATGSGSEQQAPMATGVIGGLITSTLLTLVVVPVVYTLLDDFAGLFVSHKTQANVDPAAAHSTAQVVSA